MKTPPEGDWAQPGKGLRFSRDSVLLAEFAPLAMTGSACDLGAGSGVVALEALAKGRLRGLERLWLLELDRSYEPILQENVRMLEGIMDKPPEVRLVFSDWSGAGPDDFGGPVNYVTSNPPYTEPGSGRAPRDPRRASARHGSLGSLGSLAACASRILLPGGIFTLCLPRRRLPELWALADGLGLEKSLLSFPEASPRAPALVKLVKGRGQGKGT
jgi:tRNA1Val (adenine37-N6)-methyltransferase